MDHAPGRTSKRVAEVRSDPNPREGLDHGDDCVVVYDGEHRILHWNTVCARLYGWAEVEVLGERLKDIFDSDGVDWDAACATGFWQGRVFRTTKVGGRIELDIRVHVSRKAGTIVSMIENARLLSTRISIKGHDDWDCRADRASLASERRYRNLIHNIPLPLWQVDAQVVTDLFERLRSAGMTDFSTYAKKTPMFVEFATETALVTGANDSAIAMFNAGSEKELLGPIKYLFSESPDTVMRIIAARFHERRNHVEEMKLRTLDGDHLDALVFVSFPQTPDSPDIALIMMVDVTANRRAERELRKVQSDFAHAARVSALGEMVTTIAHEVRQPLSVIATDADTGTRWLDRDVPNVDKAKSLMARITENAHRANQVISRIQDMTVKRDPVRQPVDINGVIEEALSVVEAESRHCGITIAALLDEGKPSVLGDRVQLQQVVVNLLINAIQSISLSHKQNGEILVETSASGSGFVAVSVSDSGGGIPCEYLDRIFEGFFSTKADGIGIGLAICRSIVEEHGGTIEASNNAAGARFQIALPSSTIDEVRHQTFGNQAIEPQGRQPA